MAERRLGGNDKVTAQLTITNTVQNLSDSGSVRVRGNAEIRDFELYNPNSFPVWLKIFNTAAASTTLSSAVPNEYYELAPDTVTHRPPGKPARVHTTISFAVTREPTAGATTPSSSVTGRIVYGNSVI